jgi:hypothetical protein
MSEGTLVRRRRPMEAVGREVGMEWRDGMMVASGAEGPGEV